jgi:hypothetical protein
MLSGVAMCQKSDKTKEGVKQLAWLEGIWNRTNVKPGRTAHERWEVKSDLMQGWGVSMNGTDTTFVEKLKIIIKEGELYYVADVAENQQPVYFKFTTVTEKSFVCENQQHDFPKVISYQCEGTKLKATISGNGKTIDFLFEKINP